MENTSGQKNQILEKFGQSPDQVRREDDETYQSLEDSVNATHASSDQSAKPSTIQSTSQSSNEGEDIPKRDESPIQKPDEKPSTTGNWGEKFRSDETLSQAPGASDQGGGYIRNYSADVDGNRLS